MKKSPHIDNSLRHLLDHFPTVHSMIGYFPITIWSIPHSNEKTILKLLISSWSPFKAWPGISNFSSFDSLQWLTTSRSTAPFTSLSCNQSKLINPININKINQSIRPHKVMRQSHLCPSIKEINQNQSKSLKPNTNQSKSIGPHTSSTVTSLSCEKLKPITIIIKNNNPS